uniref:Uncharacterized protein n=1 Tax=Chrysotila carterae TaxID=13221 RepID=A0A7S4BQ89_CHRCT
MSGACGAYLPGVSSVLLLYECACVGHQNAHFPSACLLLRRLSQRLAKWQAKKAQYDLLFDSWLNCPVNQAANRQTRALSFQPTLTMQRRSGARRCGEKEEPSGSPLCADARAGEQEECAVRVAQSTLLQFTFFGLTEERCKSELLFEAQFGMRFGKALSAKHGAGAHKVKMRMEELSAQQQARIRKLNAGDAAVYEMAKAVFDHRLRQYGIRDDPRCA